VNACFSESDRRDRSQGSRDSRARGWDRAKRRAVLARDVDDRRGEVDDIVPAGIRFTRAISRTRRSTGCAQLWVFVTASRRTASCRSGEDLREVRLLGVRRRYEEIAGAVARA